MPLIRTLLSLLVLCIIPSISLAQDEQTNFPECTEDEGSLIVLTMQDFVNQFVSFDQAISSIPDVAALQKKTSELSELQQTWWLEISPSFPRCGLALTITLLVGHTLDEYLIYLLSLQSDYSEMSQVHRTTLEQLAPESSTLFGLFIDQQSALLEGLAAVENITFFEIPYRISSQQPINARNCPSLTCDVIAQYDPNEEISVIGIVEGDPVNGNSQWLHVTAEGTSIYVHSSLATLP